ncbi:cobalt ABC transporter permease [Actinomycetes bacterium]|nr:cobalt ABC transporter permease [Actinomycetes bacterium]
MNQRSLHPFAWWAWGLGIAVTASQTPGTLALILLCIGAAMVVYSKKSDQPWAKAFAIGVQLGLIAFSIRMIIGVSLSVPIPGNTLFNLPTIPLPDWMAGIRIGGPVTSERLAITATEGLTFFTLILAISAASALANPKQGLRALPGVMHQAGVALIISTTLIPHFVTSIQRVKQARRLRGDQQRIAFRKIAVPIFEDSLQRAINLGAAMESRGYGFNDSSTERRFGSQILLSSVVVITIGVSLFLAAIEGAAIAFGIGMILLVAGLLVANKSTKRTRYRPQIWERAEWVVVATSITLISLGFYKNESIFTTLAIFILAISPLFVAPKESQMVTGVAL